MPQTAKGTGEAHDPMVSTDASATRAQPENDTIARLRRKVAKQEAQLADAMAALATAEAEGNS